MAMPTNLRDYFASKSGRRLVERINCPEAVVHLLALYGDWRPRVWWYGSKDHCQLREHVHQSIRIEDPEGKRDPICVRCEAYVVVRKANTTMFLEQG